MFVELRKKSSLETFSPEALVVRGRSKEKRKKSQDVLLGLNQRAERENRNVGTVARLVMSRRTIVKDKNPRKVNPNLRKI